MASLITALLILGPRLVYGRTFALTALAEWTADRSGLTVRQVGRTLEAVRIALVHGCLSDAERRLLWDAWRPETLLDLPLVGPVERRLAWSSGP